ncbi:MAG: YdeI/OmpD-associated family protein [Bacteroidota bacterium]
MELTSILTQSGYGCYIPLPEDIALQAQTELGKRVICEVNGIPIHCAIKRSNRIGYYIMAGKSTVQKIQAEPGDTLNLVLRKDDTPYQMAMCAELEEVLFTDPEAEAFFKRLSDGKKRSLIHHVSKAKHSDTRINRALALMENLKRGKTELRDLTRS